MGTNNLTDYSSTPIAQSPASRFDQYRNSLLQDLVPRNSSGSPEANAGKLGTQTLPWSEGNFTAININGTPFDPNNLLTDANQIRSGAVRSGSEQPLFLQASGSSNALTILGATTNLIVTINSSSTTVNTNISVSSLTTAPATNNTALVNNADLSGQDFTKYITAIDYDTAGSEITSLDGKFAAFELNGEYFIAKVDNTNSQLKVYQRGFFFDDNNDPITRQAITNNDTITLCKLAWIYLDNTGTTADIGYTTPIYASAEPSSPATGDYWFDVTNQQWKRYDGSVYQNVNRILIGYAVINTSNCVATRCIDFSKTFYSTNTFSIEKATTSTIQTITDFEHTISIYGNNFYYNGRLTWDMATDLESGVVEANDTTYYFYITNEGGVKISDERPIFKKALKGVYHPFHTWRWVGTANNDSSGNLEEVKKDYVGGFEVIKRANTTASVQAFYWLKPEGISKIRVNVTGSKIGAGGAAAECDAAFMGLNADGGGAYAGGSIDADYILGNAGVDLTSSYSGFGSQSDTLVKYFNASDLDVEKVVFNGGANSNLNAYVLIEYIG